MTDVDVEGTLFSIEKKFVSKVGFWVRKVLSLLVNLQIVFGKVEFDFPFLKRLRDSRQAAEKGNRGLRAVAREERRR